MNKPIYLALGDSISIDRYPDLDAQSKGLTRSNLGAASLLYSNQNDIWPDYAGRDLLTSSPDLELIIAAQDGATAGDLRLQARVAQGTDVELITVSAGGNDLLNAYSVAPDNGPLDHLVNRQIEKLRFIYQKFGAPFPAL